MLTLICRHFVARASAYYALIAITLLTLVPTLSLVPPGEHLTQITAKDFITVHTRNTPTTYYQGRQALPALSTS